MTQEQKQPTAAIVAGDQPAASSPATEATTRQTLRERLRTGRWLGLLARDWAVFASLLIASTAGTWLLLTLQHRMPASTQPIGLGLLLAWSLIMGALTVYVVLHRMISDLGLGNRSLIELSHASIGESRSLIDQARTMIERAYAIGQEDGRADWQALAERADAAEQRIDDLERQLAERRQPLPVDAAALARLNADIERLRAAVSNVDRKADDLPVQSAKLDQRLDEIQAEINALRNRVKPDPMDEWILNLLSRNPQPSDKQIAQIVGISASRVLQRRTKLAAAGYPAAQKRQGQRPSSRQTS